MATTPVRSKGRTGRPWRRVAARVYAEETVCWVCGEYVDQTLPPRTPRSRSVDHVVPLSRGGDPLNRANLRLAHIGCNTGRSNRSRAQRTLRAVVNSRRW